MRKYKKESDSTDSYENAYQYSGGGDGDGHPSDRDWRGPNRNKGDGHPNTGDW